MRIKESKKLWIGGGILLLILGICIVIFNNTKAPTLTLKVPNEKISVTNKDEIIIKEEKLNKFNSKEEFTYG